MSFYDLLLECAFQIQQCIVGFFILNCKFVPIFPNKTDYWLNTRGVPSHLLITVKLKLIKHFCFNFTHTTQTKFRPAHSHLRSPTKSRNKPTGYISPSRWFAAQFRNFCPLRALEPTPPLNFSSNCHLLLFIVHNDVLYISLFRSITFGDISSALILLRVRIDWIRTSFILDCRAEHVSSWAASLFISSWGGRR